jgi:hypothetical protein
MGNDTTYIETAYCEDENGDQPEGELRVLEGELDDSPNPRELRLEVINRETGDALAIVQLSPEGAKQLSNVVGAWLNAK